ncbi:GNAT family N-acetyltransferase [Bauldia litoralis]|uniref:Ribosomal-protein-alanine N-acetyltransferase n=1 Tax=Bauldia litoralis TaxID=665467 RepID=A0A1G6C700_9HYPH|nr:GNAT family protein [Bauldia litoralis]SDB28647.1 ribosomal-protein-alanine N-acetyltransferase [Bauldia litoralis]
MAFLRSISTVSTSPTIRAERVLLRAPMLADYPQWAKLREDSRSFLAPWEPIWPADDLTKLSFRRRIRRYQREIRNGSGYPMFVFSPDGETLLGGLTLSQVQRGVAQSAVLGYWMGMPFAGKGYMSASVRAMAAFAFDTLHLNRIDAACLPHNQASIQLLETVGFRREGYARKFLCIDGRWQDHLLYGLVRDDPRT